MDYRYYRGDGPRIPPKLRRYLRYLRPLGVILAIIAIAIPFLTLVKVIHSSIFSNLVDILCIVLGPLSYLIGLSFDTYVDRSK